MTSNDQEIRGFTAAEANQFREDLDLRLQQHPLSQAVRFTDNIEDCCATHRSIIATPARNDVQIAWEDFAGGCLLDRVVENIADDARKILFANAKFSLLPPRGMLIKDDNPLTFRLPLRVKMYYDHCGYCPCLHYRYGIQLEFTFRYMKYPDNIYTRCWCEVKRQASHSERFGCLYNFGIKSRRAG